MFLTAACATVSQGTAEDRTLQFGCTDTVVIGRIENGAFQDVTSENDILGHGWVTAKVLVRRVVKGANVPPLVPVRYFAHAYMRDDRDFMLVLKPTSQGYEIRTGQLMWLRPRLASRCIQTG